MTPEEFINATVGKPWKKRADGPEAYDCAGLIRASYQHIDGISLPEWEGYKNPEWSNSDCIAEEKRKNAGKLWMPSQPTDGALAVFYDSHGFPAHVGRCLAGGVLHCLGKDDAGQVQWHTYKMIKQMPFSAVEYYRYAGNLPSS